MQYFPFIFTLFMFVLALNMLGMMPYSFTVTSHIIVTFALAAFIFLAVTAIGFWKHGIGFLKFFVPAGVPAVMLPLLVVIEVISYLTRPLSLSVRLFANMMAGHTMLKVFGALRGGARAARRLGAARLHGRLHRLGNSGRVPAGLRVRDPHLHLSQRCTSHASLGFNFIVRKGERTMDPSAAKLIGAGLASIALVGAGVGIGTIFGNYLQGALRNPSAAPGQFANLLLGFALAEATGLFGLVVALIILFVF